MSAPVEMPHSWEDRLYPEATFPKYPYLKQLKPLLRTLAEIGVLHPWEAEEGGYLQLRPADPPRRPALWIHVRHLSLLEEIAAEIALLRLEGPDEEEASSEESREDVREEINRLLDALPWLAPARRKEVAQWAFRSARRQSPEALSERILFLEGKRLLERAGLRLQASSNPPLRLFLGTGEVAGTFLGERVERSLPLGTLTLGPESALRLLAEGPEAWTENLLASLPALRELRREELAAEYQRLLAAVEERVESLSAFLPLESLKGAVRSTLSEESIPLPRLILESEEVLDNRIWAGVERWLRSRLGAQVKVERSRGGGVRFTERAELPAVPELDLPLPRHYTLRHEDARPLSEWLGPQAESHLHTLKRTLKKRLEARLKHWLLFLEGLKEEWVIRQNATLYEPRLLLPLFQEVIDEALREEAPERLLASLRQALRPLDEKARDRSTLHQVLEERGMGEYLHLFPRARSLTREIVLFAGPTNSGKTHRALDALVEAESGVYLAPLRLLALEGQEALQRRGVEASFLTGEERDLRPGARFTASTIEMLDLSHPVAAAVIDEAQMLADRHRGWAWTQALVGVPAERIFLTGAVESIPLVEELARYLKEPLQVVHLERFAPLNLLSSPTPFSEIKPGTAIIAFSRRDVLGLKEVLSRHFQVSVIYGNLTPQVRREEARRFRSGETQILVATDAIAMGLNLPIETVLFYRTEKWNGRDRVPLSPGEILQIGGRAGRYGIYEEGWVGAMDPRDLGAIRSAFHAPLFARALPERFRVRPTVEHLDVFADVSRERRLSRLLEQFHQHMVFDHPGLRSGVTEEMRVLAEITDSHLDVPLPERYTFASSPVDLRSEAVMGRFEQWFNIFARGEVAPLPRAAERFLSGELPRKEVTLARAEDLAKELTLYAWLAFRYPATFPDLAASDDARLRLDRQIEEMLLSSRSERACAACGKPLPPLHAHSLCERCFSSGRRASGKGGKRKGGRAPARDEDEWG